MATKKNNPKKKDEKAKSTSKTADKPKPGLNINPKTT